MKTLSVLLTFGLLIAANGLAARLAHVNALPARQITETRQRQIHATDFFRATLPSSNDSHTTNSHEEKL